MLSWLEQPFSRLAFLVCITVIQGGWEGISDWKHKITRNCLIRCWIMLSCEKRKINRGNGCYLHKWETTIRYKPPKVVLTNPSFMALFKCQAKFETEEWFCSGSLGKDGIKVPGICTLAYVQPEYLKQGHPFYENCESVVSLLSISFSEDN